jgi:hypothetical protein
LDYAAISESAGDHHDEIIELLIQNGALSVATIKEMAATNIQVI